MKAHMKFNGQPTLVIKYDGEWEDIKSILENKLGLVVAETARGFGMGTTVKYYRETNQDLKRYLDASLGSYYKDDINSPIMDFDRGVFNIAILRVVPDETNHVIIPISRYLTIADLNKFMDHYAEVIGKLLSLAIDTEIKIKFQREKG
jgi:hypothetical protein